jgi:NAD(P)-dependent dehydrogenase (short-subunit alcohol dehydrogenase family)
MQLNGKTVVVTGGAQGIGAALSRRFAAAEANVVVADLDASASQAVAAQFGGLGVACDVTSEEQIQQLVASTQAKFGAIDLFCSNAGVCLGEPDLATSASNADWQKCWDIHVMSHVYAARAVLPAMVARGDGYFVQMASAAGLLSQIGDAAYSASKHAAVGFAESLAITHGADGIKVSVVCPQYVATPMLGYSGTQAQNTAPGVLSAEDVAQAVMEGIEEERFLVLPHPQVEKFVQHKANDYDRWINGMQRLRTKIMHEVGSTDLEKMHRFV